MGGFWFATRYGLLFRYDFFDPDTENDKDTGEGYRDEKTLLLGGVWVEPVNGIRLCANYRQYDYTAKIVDDQGDRVAMQPDRSVFLNTEFGF
ncbi:MAG: hypothetical protein M5R36_12135 [Deltaproteobacteria bacterium]|nr:hypothetical protein [Deltaproteobacteria bacterium]